MAYIRKTGSEQNALLSGGVGGVAGEGGQVSTRRQETAAGTPGGWTNIQEFMRANPQAPAARTRIEQGAAQKLGEAKQGLQSQISGLQQMPTAQKYSEQRFGDIRKGGVSGQEAQQLRGFLDQSFAGAEPGTQQYEKSAAEQIQGVRDPFQGMKSGDLGSILGWYGNIERPSAAYTPGMQKMDEMLLRGQKGFSTDLPQQMQQQFQTQVTDVMNKERADLEKRQNIAKQQFSDEGKQWFQGITGFLGGEEQKVKDRLAEQRTQLELEGARSQQDIMGDYYQDINPFADKTSGYLQADRVALTPEDYIRRGTITDPTRETAAAAQFTPEQMETFNVLSGLLPEAGFEQYTGSETFDPGKWQFDKEAFEEDYRTTLRDAKENYLRKQIDNLLKMKPVQYTEGEDPYKDKSYSFVDVPEFLDTKYGRERIRLDEAGKRIYQPSELITGGLSQLGDIVQGIQGTVPQGVVDAVEDVGNVIEQGIPYALDPNIIPVEAGNQLLSELGIGAKPTIPGYDFWTDSLEADSVQDYINSLVDDPIGTVGDFVGDVGENVIGDLGNVLSGGFSGFGSSGSSNSNQQPGGYFNPANWI